MTARYVLGALRRRRRDDRGRGGRGAHRRLPRRARLVRRADGVAAHATGRRACAGRLAGPGRARRGPGRRPQGPRRRAGLRRARPVDYAKVAGLRSTSAAGTRTTGAAYVVAVPDDYARFAPSEIRTLVGPDHGFVLQQQTAANLAAEPGATVEVLGTGRPVRVTGVADLPNADSFFQVVGAPAGPVGTPAPDNVLLVPPAAFGALTSRAAVVHQFHVRLDHRSLPSDPAAAADETRLRANHYVTAVAGGAIVGDDLGAALSAAREDALYARLLVLLLGLPGLVLSAVVAALMISLRNDRQRRDLALLRLRGVTPRRATVLLGLTALADGLLGAAPASRARSPRTASRSAPARGSPCRGWSPAPWSASSSPSSPRSRPSGGCCGAARRRWTSRWRRRRARGHRSPCGSASTSCSSPARGSCSG